MNIVEMQNVSKKYSNSRKVEVAALKNINLTIEKGKFVAIVGPSGSGKSTLLHLMGGLDASSEGSIIVDGMDIGKLPENELSEFHRKKIGFVFQKFHLIPMLNVRENIVLPIALGGEPVDHAYIDELIGFLGLKERENHLPGELSGGQQQRVGIGRALAAKADVLLADEPTGNLDQDASGEIMEYFRELNQRYGKTIVMITHDMELAKRADEIVQIVDGRIVEG
ncbi:macrolide export ATP-binding/permease protein MacB [Lachnospiraceae bacterium]|nr:ABC transporter ATP-binding protein [Lachnospiraceae bacterium]MCI9058220.1 ABC transporter ATP-binding protein [Lachnospiraceae bacterium]GFI31138.1 macrolide export ATP-binding/permease protein MacB [Lachnospiraceae bacterium]